MNFNSLEFLIFLPIIVLLTRILPHKFRWMLLLAASYYFYMRWNAKLVVLILSVTVLTFLAGRIIEKSRNKLVKRTILGLSTILSLGLLFYFKYFNFLLEAVNRMVEMAGGRASFALLDIVLPVGISFYTFQALSYVIDVYRGQSEAEHHFGYYALYVSFFPQLVAGPIERMQNLMPQLKANKRADRNDLKAGLLLLLSGFFRKVAVADVVGTYVTNVFSGKTPTDGAAVVMAAFLFSVQIYCDFAGYSEIASGSARLMGIHLMKNFDRPYAAIGIRDFWKRWHISLTSWFKDYIYIPLGGSRRGKVRHQLAILVVFLVSGLWHGASWTFLLWGLFHAVCYMGEQLTTNLFGRGKAGKEKEDEKYSNKKYADKENTEKEFAEKEFAAKEYTGKEKKVLEKKDQNIVYHGKQWLKNVVTVCLVSFSWIFFRSASLTQVTELLRQIPTVWNGREALLCLGMDGTAIIHVVFCLFMLPFLNRMTKKAYNNEAIGSFDNAAMVLLSQIVLLILLSWMMHLEQSKANAFLYFQF